MLSIVEHAGKGQRRFTIVNGATRGQILGLPILFATGSYRSRSPMIFFATAVAVAALEVDSVAFFQRFSQPLAISE